MKKVDFKYTKNDHEVLFIDKEWYSNFDVWIIVRVLIW